MFSPDSRTETFLTTMGVSFEYAPSVEFSALKRGWEGHNIARPTPQRQEAILEYALLMEQGSAAPAVILHLTPAGLDVLDGVQRLSAAQVAGASQVAAYLVSCDSDNLLTAIRLLANVRLQGHQEKPEWTRRQAVEHLVIQRGMSCAEVARMGGWREADVRRLSEVMDYGFKLRCLGAPLLPDSLIEAIRKRIPIETVHKAVKPVVDFLDASQRANFSASDLEPHLDAFLAPYAGHNWHEELTDRLEHFLHTEEVNIRLHGRQGQPMSHDINLRRALRSVITVLDGIAGKGGGLPYIEEFQQLVNVISKRLKEVKR